MGNTNTKKFISVGILLMIVLLTGYWLAGKHDTYLRHIWCRQSDSRIIHVTSLSEVKKFLDQEVLHDLKKVQDALILFDLDNTLIEPTTALASDQWFDASLRFYQENGLSLKQAVDKLLPIWIGLFKQTTMKPVEPETVKFVSNLQLRLPVIAFTARDSSLRELTAKQLQALGITFNTPVLAQQSFDLEAENIYFTQGVLFCSGQDKCHTLLKFLKQLCLQPHLIVFVDDKEHHLQSVAKAAEQVGARFVGFRYGFLDVKVKNFLLDSYSIQLLKKHMPIYSQDKQDLAVLHTQSFDKASKFQSAHKQY